MAFIKKSANARGGLKKKEPSYTLAKNVYWCSHYGKQNGVSLKKLKIELLYDPTNPLIGIYLEKTNYKRYMHSSVHSSTIYNRQDVEAA